MSSTMLTVSSKALIKTSTLRTDPTTVRWRLVTVRKGVRGSRGKMRWSDMVWSTSPRATYVRSVPNENINTRGQIIYRGSLLPPLSPERKEYNRIVIDIFPPSPQCRHVRVNHPDKDLNDTQLREVLAQRLEGGTRGRRRRHGTGS